MTSLQIQNIMSPQNRMTSQQNRNSVSLRRPSDIPIQNPSTSNTFTHTGSTCTASVQTRNDSVQTRNDSFVEEFSFSEFSEFDAVAAMSCDPVDMSHDLMTMSCDQRSGSHDTKGRSDSNSQNPIFSSHDLHHTSADNTAVSHDLPLQSHDPTPKSCDLVQESHALTLNLDKRSHDIAHKSHDLNQYLVLETVLQEYEEDRGGGGGRGGVGGRRQELKLRLLGECSLTEKIVLLRDEW